MNLNYALSKQKEYDTKQSQCMIKYENKVMSNMKGKPKRFFSYVNSKKRIKQSVVSVKNAAGDLAKSPKETADILASFFESTYSSEPLGPLPPVAESVAVVVHLRFTGDFGSTKCGF